MEVYRYQDEKSDKFWRIKTAGTAFAVNCGKTGTTGKYQIKEFDSEEACEKEANKLIAAKQKKGYLPYEGFDPDAQLYMDDEEFGLHPLTAHPRFRAHFTDEFYYDCTDEEAPFGSDEGSDTFSDLQEYVKKNREIDIYEFPQKVLQSWDMPYLPPDTLDLEEIKAIIAQPDDTIPISQHLIINDQVIIAAAFGQVKIMGKVSLRLKAQALRSLQRWLIVNKLLEYPAGEIIPQMIHDLERFENPPRPAPSETAQALIRYLGCPCEVFGNLLDDDDMIYSYEQALQEGKAQDYTPLLVVADETLLEAVTMAIDEENDTVPDPEKMRAYREQTIREALELDPKEVLKSLLSELEEDEKTEIGSVKGGKPIHRFSAFWNYDSQLSKEVILARIPTANPWELPVFVPMGGFNDCPSPAQQAAVMKHWYEKYGAVPGLCSYDVWEFILPTPVTDQKTALDLAMEHYSFCYDRVEQYGSGYTIGKLAHCLMHSTVWYFWWD